MFLKNFDLLKSIGVLDQIDQANKRIQTLETLLVSAWETFTKDSIESIIEYVKDGLDELFIPEDLIFIIRGRSNADLLQVFAYRNLKRSKCSMTLKSIKSFEVFFKNSPSAISFDEFAKAVDDRETLDQFPDIPLELIVPIVGFSGLYGIILFGKKILGTPYTEDELSYIDKLMKFTSIAIQNTIHYQGSVRDLKTDLYNCAFFKSRLNEEISRAKRYKKKFGLLILDIDNFKRFNDSYGHLAGDEALIQISKTLNEVLRRADILARFGGEEFIILLPELNKISLYLAAERIRTAIREMRVHYKKKELKLTVSVGGACFDEYNCAGAENLLNQADIALYTSKSKGRDKTTIFRPGFLFKTILYKNESGSLVNI